MNGNKKRIWLAAVIFLLIGAISIGSVLANTDDITAVENLTGNAASTEEGAAASLPAATEEAAQTDEPATDESQPGEPAPAEPSDEPTATQVPPEPVPSGEPSAAQSSAQTPNARPSDAPASAAPEQSVAPTQNMGAQPTESSAQQSEQPSPTPTVYDRPEIFLADIVAKGSDKDLELTEQQKQEIDWYIGEGGTTE